MEYKNQTENRAFQEMLQAAVKRLQNRSGEDLAAKSGAVFHSNRNMLEVPSFHDGIPAGRSMRPCRWCESGVLGLCVF